MKSSKTTIVLRKGLRRRIQLVDVQDMAELLAQRLTETEACVILGIDPPTWWNYRREHEKNPDFSAVLSRARANQIKANLDNMQDAAFGRNGHRADWRASDRLLQIKAPERFGIRNEAPSVNVSVQVNEGVLRNALKRVYGTDQVVDAQLLTEAKP